MDDKDKKIKLLEQDIARLKAAFNIMEARMKQLANRAVRTDEAIRRTNNNIDMAKRRG